MLEQTSSCQPFCDNTGTTPIVPSAAGWWFEGYLECNDGNVVANDGCTNCYLDPGYTCSQGGAYASAAETCSLTCGDGVMDIGEECDLLVPAGAGSGTNEALPYAYLSGCTDTCRIEPGFVCAAAGLGPCTATCGDGI